MIERTSDTLLLFPTELELSRFRDQGGIDPELAISVVCGFGPVAAAARTAQLVAQLAPTRLVLIGIAGAYDTTAHPIGSALRFSRVAIDGVGVGEGTRFVGPPRLGFPQWPGSEEVARVDDAIDLDVEPGEKPQLLLTTCAASDSREHAAERLARFPTALAEDMEGFAIAMVGRLHGLPVEIVRGISNRVGDRDPKSWRIPQALAEARRLLIERVLVPARR
jgi:futalosine hydrolase